MMNATYRKAVRSAIETLKAGTAKCVQVDHEYGPRFIWRNARGLILSAHTNGQGKFYDVQIEAE